MKPSLQPGITAQHAFCIPVEKTVLHLYPVIPNKAHDGIDLIGQGENERMIVNWEKFEESLNDKAKRAWLPPISRKAQ